MPPPISSQSDRSWFEARANLGNQPKGPTQLAHPTERRRAHRAITTRRPPTSQLLPPKCSCHFPKKKLAFSVTIPRISVISCDRKPRTSKKTNRYPLTLR